MKGEKEDLSFLDLITYYESGPVLKQRTPDVIRTPSHPHELVFNYADDTDEAGKRLTKRKKLEKIHKKAIGLTDIPGGSPPGAQGWRPRSHYEQQDFEASHISGFGGPSVIDVQEDKPPSNISRLEKRKPINIPLTTETDNFFSFLQTGKLRRRRIPKKGSGMNLEQRELTKLAKALRMSGYNSQADIVVKLAKEDQATADTAILTTWDLSPEQIKQAIIFKEYWNQYVTQDMKDKAAREPNKAFVEAAYGTAGIGTNEALMVAVIYYYFEFLNKKDMDFGGLRAGLGFGKKYNDMTIKDIITAELSGQDLAAAEFAKTTDNDGFFNGDDGVFREKPKPASTGRGGGQTAGASAGQTEQVAAAPTSRYSADLNNRQWAWAISEEAQKLQQKLGFTGNALDGKFGTNSKRRWAEWYPNTPLPATAAVALDYANKTDQGTEGNGEAPTAESIAAAERAKEATETEVAKPAEPEVKPEGKEEGEETEHYESDKVLGKTNEDDDGSVGVYLDDGKYYPAFLFEYEGSSYWLPIKDRGKRTHNAKENFLTRSEQREIRKSLKPTAGKGPGRREERRTRRKSRRTARQSRRDARRAGRGR